MTIIKVKNNDEAGTIVSNIIANKILEKPNLVLGLATGTSPISTYKKLIEKNQEHKISFKAVKTFNLDEYTGLEPTNPHSYRYFMNHTLFNHIDIDINNTFFPSEITPENPQSYDNLILKNGGIDLQILGLGINGHIGFNEPLTSFDSLTSIVKLARATITANSRFFKDKNSVPKQAITMGLKSILNAKEIVLIATGTAKQEAVKHLIAGPIDPKWPCSVLLNHPHVTVVIDEAAAKLVTLKGDLK